MKIYLQNIVITYLVIILNTSLSGNIPELTYNTFNHYYDNSLNLSEYKNQIIYPNDIDKDIIFLKDTTLAVDLNCKAEKVQLEFPNIIVGVGEYLYKNWEYVLRDFLTGDTIQYSYNFTPKPGAGKKGQKQKDGYKSYTLGNVRILAPLSVGHYQLIRYFKYENGTITTAVQNIYVRDLTPPTPLLVDIANINLVDGKSEIKAKWFDKGGCLGKCLSSFDNCKNCDLLFFTFTNVLPDLESDPEKAIAQSNSDGRIYFNPISGEIMDKSDYDKGIADAFYPNQNTTSRVFLAENFTEDKTNFMINIFVWDELSMDNSFGDRNYDFRKVKILFNL